MVAVRWWWSILISSLLFNVIVVVGLGTSFFTFFVFCVFSALN